MSKPMKKANELPQFTGPFQELIPKYISYKRAQGYKIGSPICSLKTEALWIYR